MIKIYKYGEVSNDEIFFRGNIASNVEGVVSEIIANVINNKDKALFEEFVNYLTINVSEFYRNPEQQTYLVFR